MAGPARLKGDSLHLTIGTTELFLQATSVVMDNEEADGDVTTFADAAEGGARQFFFQITALQSLEAFHRPSFRRRRRCLHWSPRRKA